MCDVFLKQRRNDWQLQQIQKLLDKGLNPFSSLSLDKQGWNTIVAQRNAEIKQHEAKIIELQQQLQDVRETVNGVFLNQLQQQAEAKTIHKNKEVLLFLQSLTSYLDNPNPSSNVAEKAVTFWTQFRHLQKEYKSTEDTTKTQLEEILKLHEGIIQKSIQELEEHSVEVPAELSSSLKIAYENFLQNLKVRASTFQQPMHNMEEKVRKYTKEARISQQINEVKDKIQKIHEATLQDEAFINASETKFKKRLQDIRDRLTSISNFSKRTIDIQGAATEPEKNNPDFAEQLYAKHKDLQMGRAQPGVSNCQKDEKKPQEYRPSPVQKLIGLLLHPRLKKYRGFLANHGVGVGKTLAGAEAIRTWHEFASNDLDVSRIILILVQNNTGVTTWTTDLRKLGLVLTSVENGAKTFHYRIEGSSLTDLIIQVFSSPMEQSMANKFAKTGQWTTLSPQQIRQFNQLNNYESFPEIYKNQSSRNFPTPLTLKESKTERFLIPKKGLIVIDEAHLAINPQTIQGNVLNMRFALQWTLNIYFTYTAKLLLLTATPIANPSRLLDHFKMLNVLKFPWEPKSVKEGVWREPVGVAVSETAEEQKSSRTVDKLEEEYQKPFFSGGTQYERLLQEYSGLVSYMTLENDPTLYPQVTTTCVECQDDVKGCMVQAKQKDLQFKCNSDEESKLLQDLRVVPVYITRPKGSKTKSNLADKLRVSLQLLKKFNQEKHFVFVDVKTYQSFWRGAQNTVPQGMPKYDMMDVVDDILRISRTGTPIQNAEGLVATLLNDSGSKLAKRKGGLLLFLQTRSKVEVTAKLKSQELFQLVKTITKEGGGGRGSETERVSTNQKFLKELMKDLFNVKQNNDGSLFRAFVGDTSTREGLSFLLLRNVHILTVPKNTTDLIQAVGRGLRRCSFADERDVNKWKVRVYLYIQSDGPCTAPSTSKKIGGTGNECDMLRKLVQFSEDSVAERLQNFNRTIAIDCILFGLYTRRVGEKIACGSHIYTEEEFKTRFQPITHTISTLTSTIPQDPTPYGSICVIDDKAFERTGSQGQCVSGTLLKFTPYNQVDAFVYVTLLYEAKKEEEERLQKRKAEEEEEARRKKLQEEQKARETKISIIRPIMEEKKEEKQPPPPEQKPKSLWESITGTLGRFGSYLSGSTAENEFQQQYMKPYVTFVTEPEVLENREVLSFRIMYPYLSGTKFVTGRISYQQITYDISLVTPHAKAIWKDSLDLKYDKTRRLLGNAYVENLDQLAKLHQYLMLDQTYGYEELLKLKEKMHAEITPERKESSDAEICYLLAEAEEDIIAPVAIAETPKKPEIEWDQKYPEENRRIFTQT